MRSLTFLGFHFSNFFLFSNDFVCGIEYAFCLFFAYETARIFSVMVQSAVFTKVMTTSEHPIIKQMNTHNWVSPKTPSKWAIPPQESHFLQSCLEGILDEPNLAT
jgi:hypothetical protein